MKKGILGAITAGLIVTAATVGTTSDAPASALSLFGFELNLANSASTPHPQAKAAVAPLPHASTAATNDNPMDDGCLQYADHEYEVCVAYIFNASLADLVPYYKYVHSANNSAAHFVSYRLDSRYTGQANTLLRDRVANWPIGTTDVGTPSIKILSVHADLTNNTATLTTTENWKVTSQTGQILFQEINAPHTVIMQRVPSYLLHKWVVTSIQ